MTVPGVSVSARCEPAWRTRRCASCCSPAWALPRRSSLQAGQVFACGGLVAPDGDVRLAKATTFVAWSGGVEHYVTSFAFTGAVTDVGWIVPLPAVPTSIKEAGAWTLQRLEREFAHRCFQDFSWISRLPPGLRSSDGHRAGAGRGPRRHRPQGERSGGHRLVHAQRLPRVAGDQGPPAPLRDRPAPIFMAAKYNTSLALERHQQAGDGVPLLITMRTPHLWVPLEILANAGSPGQRRSVPAHRPARCAPTAACS